MHWYAHHLVALAWLDRPSVTELVLMRSNRGGKKHCLTIDHLDGDHSNNHPANLEFKTRTKQARDDNSRKSAASYQGSAAKRSRPVQASWKAFADGGKVEVSIEVIGYPSVWEASRATGVYIPRIALL